MLEFLIFSVTAVALYLLSDWILRLIEARAGAPLEHRTLIFFALFLGSLLLGFGLIRQFLGG